MASEALFRDWLEASGINPADTLIMRHTPQERKLRQNFPSKVLSNPPLFNSYQRSQFLRQERQLTRFRYLASFWGAKRGTAVFVGLFENVGPPARLTPEEYRNIPDNKRLFELGMNADNPGRNIQWFNLKRMEKFDPFNGKLVIRWTGGERNWSRAASGIKNAFPILAGGFDGPAARSGEGRAGGRSKDRKTDANTPAAATQSYFKYFSQYEAKVHPDHDRLQKQFEAFLSTNALKFRRNLNFVDLQYTESNGGRVLIEVKPCTRSNARFAIRTAMGQLLDYRQLSGKRAKMLIVIGAQPLRRDLKLATSNGFQIAYPKRRTFALHDPLVHVV